MGTFNAIKYWNRKAMPPLFGTKVSVSLKEYILLA